MPFTVSHAAAILPIRARWVSTSALVIGAMTPDVPLFAPFLPYTTDQTHTLFGLLFFNLLVGFALFVIWHGFLARPADWFAPSGIRARLAPHQQPGLRSRLATPGQILGVFASLFIGGLTHQFLDLFTHAGTIVTGTSGFFHAEFAGMPVYYVLQVMFSVIGLVLLAWWGVRWYRDAQTYPVERRPSVLGKIAARVTVVGAALAATLFTAVALVGSDGLTGSAIFAVSVVPVMTVGVTSALIAAFWHMRRTLN
ncbi:MAG: DUF4184 family protein [Candidatus Nanopelagicales bacterium]|nr:DUF4184 family protein [Candidatus Nanopelagicales bacterium]